MSPGGPMEYRPDAEQLKAKSETVLYSENRPPYMASSLGPQPYPTKSYPNLEASGGEGGYGRPDRPRYVSAWVTIGGHWSIAHCCADTEYCSCKSACSQNVFIFCKLGSLCSRIIRLEFPDKLCDFSLLSHDCSIM